jgi:Cu/Ag efflux pump CusA
VISLAVEVALEQAVSETAVRIVAAKTAAALISFCTCVPFLLNGHGLEVLPALALPKSGLTVED